MALCVVNYPTLRDEDLAWIQSVRKQYDPLFYNVIAPHFTLVFPTEAVSQQALSAHVARIAAAQQPFQFTFRCAIVGDPAFMDHAHAFLIPDEGFSDVVRLHDRLYTDVLTSELRLDLPFIPHVGVANTTTVEACKSIVDQLNRERFEIQGQVRDLNILSYDGQRIRPVEHLPLNGVG
ncbi:MAG: 2'-5' RNA ligase family protein [Planctomycetota bacterium]